MPDVLQQVRLPLIEFSVCNQTEWYGGQLDDTMVCAGYEHGGRDTCQVCTVDDGLPTSHENYRPVAIESQNIRKCFSNIR